MQSRILSLGGVAIALAWLLTITGPLSAQQGDSTPNEATGIDYTKGQKFTHVFSAYTPRFVPPVVLANSRRLEDLIVDGQLRLSLADTIALALENNLEIAVARYNLPIAETDLLRAKGGGASRGVAGAYQSNTIFSAELGASVGGGRASSSSGAGGILGGGIPTLGSVGCCDPSVSLFYGWDTAFTPLDYTVVSGVPVESTHSAYLSASVVQGFLTGTSVYAGVNGYRESSNATTELYNPFVASNLYVGLSQQLLSGFGYRANAKFIRISQNDLKYSRSVFRQHVVDILSKVMSTYYDLLTDLDTIRVSQEELASVKDLLGKQQLEVHARAVAASDLLTTQRDVVARQQDLLASQNTFDQDSQSLKAEICKNFSVELANSRITPTDSMPEPRPDDIPSLAEALQEADRNRPEIEQAQLNLGNQDITIEAVRNGLLPGLLAYGEYAPSGLAPTLDPSLSNVIHNRYANYAYGVRLNIPLGNRTAQADAARALLEKRQLEMQLQQAQNQSVWDVSKAVSAVQQARGQLDATLELTKLARQVVEVEKKKFAFALAGVEEVIGSERELATAENSQVRARASYAKALIQFELATGTILDRNNIELSDAVRAQFPKRDVSASP
jgi:outer membrane protein